MAGRRKNGERIMSVQIVRTNEGEYVYQSNYDGESRKRICSDWNEAFEVAREFVDHVQKDGETEERIIPKVKRKEITA